MATLLPTRPTGSLWLVGDLQDADLARLASELTARGQAFTATPSAAAAPAAWRGDPPQAVLIDSRGDAGSALALLGELRADATLGGVPLVVLHNGDDAEAIAQASAAGADEFLEEPFLPSLLEHRLNQALRGALRLVEELNDGAPTFENGAFTSGEHFDRLVAEAAERARGSEDCVAVLAVRAEGASANFERNLTRALRAFEDSGPISHARGEVRIARRDGVHFLVVPDLGRLQDAARMGYAIRTHLQEGGEPRAQLTIGVGNSPGDGESAEALCRAAASAAQAAEQAGESALKFHSQATDQWVFERLTLERSLRHAIENEELVLHYQPKVETATRAVVGFEALVRWNHPELGMVSPGQFIPLAEETGLISPIGDWVLETACAQNRAWQDAGFAPVRMAVNLSPVQFRQPSLADKVAGTLERTGLPPECLELEVTESMLMHDIRETAETLQRFKDAGVYLSIDDFGTGYSSLSYLKGFPIDALKIDQSFIRDVTANSDDAAIVTSIILMGRSLNLKVIAEGVETEKQLSFLQVLRCDEIQGYLFSPAVPADEAQAFLTKA